MIPEIQRLAAILAASEILPGEPRDLSELLESHPMGGLPWEETTGNGFPYQLARYIRDSIDACRINYWVNRLNELGQARPGVKVAVSPQAEYPPLLRQCYDHPPFIFVDGDLVPHHNRAVAIVGSRRPTEDSELVAYQVAYRAASRGFSIVSGLARGVDAAAHRGALAANGRTIAVLGHGIDYPTYPDNHVDLAHAISARGALISQFRPGSPATSSTFLLRNSIISGLASTSLVVEAGERSGSRTEAEIALRQGRKVLLWEPQFAHQPWALWFAEQPGVHVVSDLDQILQFFELHS